jgi:hypothetical protein
MIPALGRLRQEHPELEASLGYIERHCLKKKKKKEEEEEEVHWQSGLSDRVPA